MLWLLAFGLTFVEEFVATKRTSAIADRRRLAAANWCAAFDAILVVDMILLVTDVWLAVPMMAGSWLGAWVSLRPADG